MIIVAQNLTGGRSTKSVLQLAPIKNAAFTMAARLSRFHNGLVGLRSAFTMAEILLSLTIIGVVAAITLPSLTGNINERTWNTQRKALYARFSQAIALMPALNGYGTLTEDSSSGASDAVDTAAETFITNGLSKVMKINNICDSEHLEDCGLPVKVMALNGEMAYSAIPQTLLDFNSKFTGQWNDSKYSYSQINTKAVAFETANGESILCYYNPACTSGMGETNWHQSQSKMCANFVYDLNGTKGPNTVGKDIGFITALYPTDSSVVAPVPLNYNLGRFPWVEALQQCRAKDPESRLPSVDEASAMFYNMKLLGTMPNNMWTNTVKNNTHAWAMDFLNGRRGPDGKQYEYLARCVKR